MKRDESVFTIQGRMKSFGYAFEGLWSMLRSQHNAWVHFFATIVVVVLGVSLQVSTVEWCLLVLAMAGVWSAEALNTAFEFLCDVVQPEFHPLVKKAKDVAAAAVLLASFGAAVVGAMVFLF